jgi:MFS transporter, FHS family, glucose/mannose:H+ symporter
MRFAFIFTGLGLLLCSSFFDSLRGPLLPVLSQELNLPYEKVSLFLVMGYLAAMAFGRVLISLVERFSYRRIGALLCLLAPLTAAFSFLVGGLGTLITFGILVAVTSSSIGSVANLFVLHGTDAPFRARFYGLLHAMFGLGSQAAPFFVGILLAHGWDWRWLFLLGSLPILLLGAWTQLGLPAEKVTDEVAPARPPAFRWISLQGLLVLAFALYVAAEVLGSIWLVAYLVEVRGFTVANAAPYATGFFVVMTATRFACYAVRNDRVEKFLIVGGLGVGLVSFVVGLSGYPLAFSLVGLVGPYFPLVLARMSRLLPAQAPSLTLRTLIVAQGTLAVCHFGMGYLATTFGMALAYQAPVVAYSLALLAIVTFLRVEHRLV